MIPYDGKALPDIGEHPLIIVNSLSKLAVNWQIYKIVHMHQLLFVSLFITVTNEISLFWPIVKKLSYQQLGKYLMSELENQNQNSEKMNLF